MTLDEKTIAEWSLMRLAYDYARALDRRDPKALESIFTEDSVFVREGSPPKNRTEICKIPLWLGEKYISTSHTVLNQTMQVNGDTAEGETYCIAYHVFQGQGGTTLSLNKAIRYQDHCVRAGGVWRYKRRELINDWTEVRQIIVGGAALID